MTFWKACLSLLGRRPWPKWQNSAALGPRSAYGVARNRINYSARRFSSRKHEIDRWNRPTERQFFTELTLDPPGATSDQAGVPLLDEDYLILSTIHSAKGQEWKSVFVLNVVDGCIPSDLGTGTTEELEKERRLLYVAMTRARKTICIS
jgi:superfamily I DNA/RNA helicase